MIGENEAKGFLDCHFGCAHISSPCTSVNRNCFNLLLFTVEIPLNIKNLFRDGIFTSRIGSMKGGYVFTSVVFNRGYLVLSLVYTVQSPVPGLVYGGEGWGEGTPPAKTGGVPLARTEVTPPATRTGNTPASSQDRRYPPPSTSTGKRVLATPRVVSLLRFRRRTLLSTNFFMVKRNIMKKILTGFLPNLSWNYTDLVFLWWLQLIPWQSISN